MRIHFPFQLTTAALVLATLACSTLGGSTGDLSATETAVASTVMTQLAAPTSDSQVPTSDAQPATLPPTTAGVQPPPSGGTPQFNPFASLTTDQESCLRTAWGDQAFQEITGFQRPPVPDEVKAMGDCGFLPPPQPAGAVTYAIVDTGQGICYDNSDAIACPGAGQPFFGQDAQYAANPPRYRDNGDGTVTDLVTGLMWQQQIGGKATYDQAVAGAVALNLAGYNDWRLPTLKELYSLILFDGTDVSGCAGGTCSATPFIDTAYFGFEYGDAAAGERVIDAQYWSSTQYVSTTMNGDATVFGVNFADGRIKGYPREARGGANLQFVRYVRGSPDYGVNHFADNGDGAIADRATGLTWMQADSGQALNWEGSLAYCESLSLAGHDDWRLPNAKELQSLVDYTRAPAATGSAAIDPLFGSTTIADEGGGADYPFYWSSTTHADSNGSGSFAVYVAFGEALGFMETPPNSGNTQLLDVHGAGAQRSDPKSGDPAQWSEGHGPQGDVVRVYNYARCVRGGSVVFDPDGDPTAVRPAMTIENTGGQPSPAGSQPPPGGQGTGQGPDLAAAAAQLGVTEQQLRDALGPPPPDLAAAAARLGVTEAQLRAALGVP